MKKKTFELDYAIPNHEEELRSEGKKKTTEDWRSCLATGDDKGGRLRKGGRNSGGGEGI